MSKTWSIHGQIDFKDPFKSYKDSQIASDFHKFWVKNFVKNDPKKNTLIFDCYNLIDLMERGADVQ
jgi:hypothetical protein